MDNYSKMGCILGAIILSACATPYQPTGFIGNGGFDETKLSDKYYRVTFKGNEKTSQERALDFALLRASDLMQSSGCKSFQVVKQSVNFKPVGLLLPQTQTTNLSSTQFGSYASGTATTTNYGGGVAMLNFPKAVIEVACTAEEVDVSKGIYSTDFINASLKEKYKVK